MEPQKKAFPPGKVKLLYAKSKVFVHPSTKKEENLDGYIFIATEKETTKDLDKFLGWVPASSLEPEQIAVFDKVDMEGEVDDAFVKRPMLGGRASFQIRLAELYSVQVRLPSLGWWYGSLVLNMRDRGETLPTLFFHDDICPSTIKAENQKSKDFDPFGESNELFWGGTQFLDALKEHSDLEKSTLEPSLILVNPTLEDLNNFAPTNVKREPSPKVEEKLHKMLNDVRWGFVSSFAKIGQAAREKFNQAMDDSPAPVKRYLKNPEVQRVNEEFDTARVYLAKWAMGVQEEAQKSRQKLLLDTKSRDMLSQELGLNFDKLLPEEILRAHENHREVSKVTWDSFFDHTGRLCITVNEVKDRIFHGGLNETVRGEAWLFLLGVYPWDSSYSERKDIRMVLKKQYMGLKSLWEPKVDKHEDEYFDDQKFRIEKDIQRTDRTLDIYKNEDEEENVFYEGEDVSNIKNPHLRILREILLTFNEYNDKLGYVQGMTDLLSPLYVTIQDETLAFWAFVKVMDRMERNFLSDQSGMRDQMSTLNELVQFMLPDLYIHLEKCDSNNLFFFFRMLLVWFKREFVWKDVLRLWEILWTDHYSSQFHLFIALAILQKNERIVIDHLRQFDEVLKYFNDLSMTHNLNDLLTRAELLFLKFRKMAEIMDKDDAKSPISDSLRRLLSKEIVIQRETQRVQG